MNNRLELLFRASHDPGEVFAALSSQYTVLAEPSTSEQWLCLDSADWRLHRAGMTLRDHRRGRSGELVLSVNGGERVTAPSRVGAWPRRVDGLAPSPVRDQVAPALGVRALLPMAAVDSRRVRLRLLDDADKTRVRVQVDQQRLDGGTHTPLPLRVVLDPLRGYERDAQRCADLLAATMTVLDDRSGPVAAALTAAGRVPGASGPATRHIDPLAPAPRSIAAVLLASLDVIDSVRPGVLDDVDVEFLHELRTAVRATRSILSLTGDVLPGTHGGHFAAEFAWLGRLTTPLRDLDVFLLELRGQGAVDIDGLPDLEPLRQHLLRQRRPALRALRAGLMSRRATALSGEWRDALELMATSDAPGRPTAQVADRVAQRAYARIRKAAGPVTATTPADDLHGLRRRCKRMRYLLEGFAVAFEPRSYGPVLAGLKKLQDRLGDIQDSDVQRRHLAEVAAVLTKRGAPLETVLAIGALRDRIARRDVVARGDLDRRLARFCGPGTKRLVESLQQSSA